MAKYSGRTPENWTPKLLWPYKPKGRRCHGSPAEMCNSFNLYHRNRPQTWWLWWWKYKCAVPQSRVSLDKLIIIQLMKYYPAFYGTPVHQNCHRLLIWITWRQPPPSHHISSRSILISSSHLCLDFPSGSFIQAFKLTQANINNVKVKKTL
jgi:hypothetical protein